MKGFKLKPFQEYALKVLMKKKIGGLFLRMGLGKTVISCEYIKKRNAQYNLIVCPKILISTWFDHIERYGIDIVIIEAKTTKRVESYIDEMIAEPDLKDKTVFITNYEFVYYRKPLFQKLAQILNCIVLDESTFIKNHRSKTLFKTIEPVFRKTAFKLILTGTPFIKIMDIFSQMEFLVYRFWHGGYWGFFNTFVNWILETVYVRGKEVTFKKVIGPNKEMLPQLLKLIKTKGNVVLTEDLAGGFKLPPQTNTPVGINLDEQLRDDYILFKNDMIEQVGEVKNSISAAGKMVKLQQILLGSHLKELPNKFKMLTNLLDNEIDMDDTPVLIWCRFTHTINWLQKTLSDKYSTKDNKAEVFIIDGSVKKKDRDRIMDYANKNNRCIIILQLQVGRFGLSFNSTTAAVFYELNFALLDFKQAKARIQRLVSKGGSVNFILYYKATVDQYILAGLQKGLAEGALIKSVYNSLKGDFNE